MMDSDDKMDSLVSTEWLSLHLDDLDLVVLDCTVVSEPNEGGGIRNVTGLTNYKAGHIRSAGFADLLVDLADSSQAIEFALPSPEQFCSAMGVLGVGDHSRVVLYDSAGSMWAARVWWMLRWVGFDRAAILDGGQGAWVAEDRALSTETLKRPAAQLTPQVRPRLVADRDEVLAAIDDDEVHLIDTLPPEFYRGETSIYSRPGHIPGATNICALDLLDESGRYKPLEKLAAIHDGDRSTRAITYCGGGIMASSSAFVMTQLGFTDVAVYTASLQEWTADLANPMEVEHA